MTEFEVQVAARFTALEFVLEVMIANQLAFMPAEASEDFKQALLDRQAYISRGPVDVNVMQAISAASEQVLQNFVTKVADREADIRDQLG